MPNEVKKKGPPRMAKEVRSSIVETLVDITTSITVTEVKTDGVIDVKHLEEMFDKGEF